MKRTFKLTILVILTCFTLAGCHDFIVEDPYEKGTYHTNFFQMHTKNGYAPSERREPDPVWCYQTIGAPDCYSKPQHSERSRLIQ